MGEHGSSFSYFDGKQFTLIEARVTDTSENSLVEEIKACGKNKIDNLHITSWDDDHCYPAELQKILTYLHPDRIEYPGYTPSTDSGKNSLLAIQNYEREKNTLVNTVITKSISPNFISSLSNASEYGYSRVFYHPRSISSNSNNNSSVVVFRTGCFTVASLGDVESKEIADYLQQFSIFKNEIDVLILAHHGSNCSCNSDEFIAAIKPKVAICSSNYDNEYDHPDDAVREILYNNDVYLYTTKTGDVIIESIGDHKETYRVMNFIRNSNQLSSVNNLTSKRYDKYIDDIMKSMFGRG